ncbi:Programmed cell death protein 4 [Mactra antiquata]
MAAELRNEAVVQNGDVEFSEEMEMTGDVDPINGLEDPAKPIRLIRKAKRIGRTNSGGDASSNGAPTQGVQVAKNSRKSRDGRGRGEPKKGGAGGKGTWGAPGDELFVDGSCRDSNDPNYDSDNQGDYVVEKIEPLVSPDEFDKFVTPIILEYFDHSLTKEVEASLDELNLSKMKPRIVELSISLSFDRKASHRELVSILISDLYSKVLVAKDIQKGFDNLLESIADLVIDSPEAPKLLGMFLARAVADDCLPPKYIQSYKGSVDNPSKQVALEKAELLLGQKHGIVRLDNIWGTGGGIRPVKYLIKQMVLLLKEYLSSCDIKEATRCLQELEVPHFHHELVYEATVMILEDGTERSAERMSKLLASLNAACIITPEQFSQGFKRVFNNMPDINLDVPNAYTLLERFGDMCFNDGVMASDTYKDLPRGGRKRFVSEGDGGKIKPAVL